MSVLAIVEQRMAGEVLAAAQQFGSPVVAYSIDLPYTADAYTAAAEELIHKVNPTLVVFGHTYQTRDYAPKLAARFGRVLISDVIAGKPPVFVRQMFQGKFNADVRLVGDGPHFVSIQAGAWRGRKVLLPRSNHFLRASATSRQVPEAPFREAARAVDLTAADIIVSVGRGIKEKENIPVVEALAQALGAELAASRPICDAGWLPMDRQVGSSGQTVSPKTLRRGRNLRRHPAPGRHEGREDGRRDQQGPGRPHLRSRALRNRGGFV